MSGLVLPVAVVPSGLPPGLLAVLATVLAAGAAWLALPPPGGRGRARVETEPTQLVVRRRRRAWTTAAGVAVVGVLLTSGAAVAGARGAVLAAAVVVAAATVTRVVVLHAAERRERRARADVAGACGVLASYVRVGQVPADALALVARDHPVLEEAAAVQAMGGDVPASLLARAAERGHGGLGDLARAWRVSLTTGAPMAPALEEVAAGLAADETLRSVVSAELSAPRSTGKVMAVLPLVGIGLGYLLGGRPLGWLVAGPLGWVCLLAGLLLAGGGVLWIESLARAGSAGD